MNYNLRPAIVFLLLIIAIVFSVWQALDKPKCPPGSEATYFYRWGWTCTVKPL